VSDRLQLDPRERHAATLDALASLERLRNLREVAGNHTPADAQLIDLARGAPPREAADLSEILDRFVRFAAAGWDKTSGGNFSFIPSGSLDSGTIAALLAVGANSFTGAAFEAPAMVAMEEGVLGWMAELLGLPAGAGGLLLSGGSLANQTAIVSARTRARDAVGGTMYVSERVHHSVVKAAHLIGIPSDAIRTVDTDAEGRCDPNALEDLVDADVATDHRPFLIVGVAGSTDTGSIDHLERLADVAERVGAWFHVDAAYAGFFTLTTRGRERLRGIERADSVTVDAHKGLFLPYSVGALLVREPSTLVDSHEGWGSYLRGIPTIEGLPHYFQRGPELTRPNRAALVWFPLQVHGTAAFGEELDRMLDLAEFAHQRLATIAGIEVGPSPSTSIVTFRASDGDEATDAIVSALHATGRFQVSTTTIDQRALIRFAFLSPRTTEARVAEALDVVADVVARHHRP
jgi:aromatic-L-amino-acid/L-tryptophan decarboxylase